MRMYFDFNTTLYGRNERVFLFVHIKSWNCPQHHLLTLWWTAWLFFFSMATFETHVQNQKFKVNYSLGCRSETSMYISPDSKIQDIRHDVLTHHLLRSCALHVGTTEERSEIRVHIPTMKCIAGKTTTETSSAIKNVMHRRGRFLLFTDNEPPEGWLQFRNTSNKTKTFEDMLHIAACVINLRQPHLSSLSYTSSRNIENVFESGITLDMLTDPAQSTKAERSWRLAEIQSSKLINLNYFEQERMFKPFEFELSNVCWIRILAQTMWYRTVLWT